MRVLDLRQKVLFASQEAESGFKYDPALDQSRRIKEKKTNVQHTTTVVHSVKSSDKATDKKSSATSSLPKISSSVLSELKELM